MTCPNCNQAMTEQVLGGHLGSTVTLDICHACHVFWFDSRESIQLTPASTLRLFRLIGEQSSPARRALEAGSKCPRCGLSLKLVHDLQRATRFEYRRCPREHGRLITFFDFLREKNFLTPMSPAQIDQLRRNVDSVNCSNCGAAIDLTHRSTCGHCGSALSIIDVNQAERLVAELRAADRSGQPVDPTLPLQLERARREAAEALKDVPSSGLLFASLQSLARWLKQDV
ncbi:MAG: zf-TFIIB domain-containing protein [Vicinamibacterales bacterium]